MAKKREYHPLPPTDGKQGPPWNVWLMHEGAGWWLDEEGYDNIDDAAASLAEKVGKGTTTGGAVVSARSRLKSEAR